MCVAVQLVVPQPPEFKRSCLVALGQMDDVIMLYSSKTITSLLTQSMRALLPDRSE